MKREKDVVAPGFIDMPDVQPPMVTDPDLAPGVVLRLDNRRGQRLDLMADGSILESRYARKRRETRREEKNCMSKETDNTVTSEGEEASQGIKKILNVHAQEAPHDHVYVVGNAGGLRVLGDAIRAALNRVHEGHVALGYAGGPLLGHAGGPCTTDGEGFSATVINIKDDAMLDKMMLPYTSPPYRKVSSPGHGRTTPWAIAARAKARR